jgi:hypothetical protein
VKDVDYTESIVAADTSASRRSSPSPSHAPANGAQVRYCYFTETAKAYPQAVNADATVKPGAVRGRDIIILVGTRGANEVQTITITGAPTGGTFQLTFNGAQTTAIAYNANAAAVQAALEALATVGTGNVIVTGGPGPATPYVVTFVGALGGANQPTITTSHAFTGGAGPAIAAAETTPGGTGGNRVRFSGVQTVELEATVDGEVERELGNSEITGRVINGTDVTGTVTIRPKDIDAFYNALALVTGRSQAEVFDYFNNQSIPVEVQIRNPKNKGQILKTIYMTDGQFQPPGTPARVNTATDFPFQFNSVNGTFSEFKGARP